MHAAILLLLMAGAAAGAQVTASGRQTVAGAPGKHFGFPRIVKASDGELLVVFRVGQTAVSDRGSVATVTSRDGNTWSKPNLLEPNPDPDHGWHNPFPFVTPAGKLLLWLSSLQVSSPNRRHPLFWRTSDDSGKNWTPAQRFDNTYDRSTYSMSGAANVYDGILTAAATYPAAGLGTCHTVIWHSPDGGKTWNVRSQLTKPIDNRGDDAALIETGNTVLCLLAVRHGRGLAQFRSSDTGRSWTEGQNLYEQIRCTLQHPVLTRLSKTRILLSGHDAERKQVLVYVSDDDGKTFGGRSVVETFTVEGGYTSCVATGPDSALLVYHSDNGVQRAKAEIKSVRLKVN